MKTLIEENQNITSNSKQLDILKKNFPQCFDKNGSFQPEKMNEIVKANGADIAKESYSLNWLGKSYARLLANQNPTTLLHANEKHNAEDENKSSNNLLIKGDNLEVLKHLVNAYSEKVKMIYIDPPYNTSSDGFVYNDDRKFTVEELSRLTAIDEEEAQRILDFTNRKSNSHSAWLTFMYPRLYIARELLRDDGVIFISIDDNESYNLKLLCDEIFGENNFLANFLWQKKKTTSNSKGTEISSQVDYTLSYKKNSIYQAISKRVKKKESRNYPHNDNNGKYRVEIIEKKDSGEYKRETMKFPILGYLPRMGKRWQIGEDKARKLEKLDRFIYEDGIIKLKIYDFEDNDTFSAQPNLLLSHGTSDEASRYVNDNLLGKSEIFSNPKPTELIKHFISILNDDTNNTVILDFFSGSGTTAHSVMQLNAEDGGNRQCISVQIDEPTDKKSEAYKAGYKTIFDITKARIEKAAQKIKSEHPEYAGDLGFKIFETTPVFNNYISSIDEDGEQIEMNLESLSPEQLNSLLLTWKTYDGVPLTVDLDNVKLKSYTCHYFKGLDDRTPHVYFMSKGFNNDDLVSFIQLLDDTKSNFSPTKLIIFGDNFDSKNQREIKEAVTQYSNKKSIELDVIVRY